MNYDFINAIENIYTYELKEGTTTSYYSTYTQFPGRLSMSFGMELRETKKGGMYGRVVGTIKGTFKKSEQSPLKQFKPYEVHTSLYADQGFPLLYYGFPGVSNTFGKVCGNNGDLIVVEPTTYSKETIKIHHFKGVGARISVDELKQFFRHIYNQRGL